MENKTIEILKDNLSYIKTRFKVKEIGIFGSQIKGTAKKRSDIDIIVEFEEGCKTFDNYIEGNR